MSERLDDDTIVRALVQMSGVTPAESELSEWVSGFASLRAMMDFLHAMPDLRYEEPALVFDARHSGLVSK